MREFLRGLLRTKLWLGLGLVAGVSGLALAAGFTTNGLPIVQPAGTTSSQTGYGTGYTTLPLTGSELIATDTQLSGGRSPQSEAVSIAQIRAFTQTTVALASGQTPDPSQTDFFTLALTGSGQQLPNPVLAGITTGKTFRVLVSQDGTGSRALTYGSLYSWPTSGVAANAGNPVVGFLGTQTAPNLATSANAQNILTFVYNGSSLLGSRQ